MAAGDYDTGAEPGARYMAPEPDPVLLEPPGPPESRGLPAGASPMCGQWWGVADPEPFELVEPFELGEPLDGAVVLEDPVEDPVVAVVTAPLALDEVEAPETAIPMPRLSPSAPAPMPAARRG